jgi:hypothetical protein
VTAVILLWSFLALVGEDIYTGSRFVLQEERNNRRSQFTLHFTGLGALHAYPQGADTNRIFLRISVGLENGIEKLKVRDAPKI